MYLGRRIPGLNRVTPKYNSNLLCPSEIKAYAFFYSGRHFHLWSENVKVGNEQSLARTSTRLSRVAAAISAGVGLIVLLSWIFGIEAVLNISPAFATMKVNTSIAFILLGFALWSVNARPDDLSGIRASRNESLVQAGRICAFLAMLIGLLTLIEYLFGRGLGIDNLLIRDRVTVHSPYPGRMTRLSGLNLMLIGATLLAVDLETRGGKRPAQWLAILVFLDSYTAVLGYVFGVASFYKVGGFTSMAVHTALLYMLLCTGLLLARPGKGLMRLATDTTAGGLIFRIFVPMALITVPLLAWLRYMGQRTGLYGAEFGMALLVLSNAVALSALIWWLAGMVRTHVLGRTEVEQKMETDQERAKREAAILEQRVHERTIKLEEAVAELERSTYTISHNLRAPIRSILAFADFLITDFGDKVDEGGREYLKRIKTSAWRMDTLIEGVLAYSHVSRTEPSMTAVDLDRLLDGLVADYAGEGDIQVAHPLGTVSADAFLVEQAVSNLMENAFKFVRPGTRAQIEVWSKPENGKLRLTVHDRGIGVPAESGDRIFRSFERAHEGYAGSGIGLAIVRRAVEQMGGRAGFDSKAGEGSSFWIELRKAEATTTSSS